MRIIKRGAIARRAQACFFIMAENETLISESFLTHHRHRYRLEYHIVLYYTYYVI